MNLEDARKVYWLKSNHKTLGELLDDGFLDQARLEWAAEKAYDPMLKEAAKVILESKWTQPPKVKTNIPTNKVESNAKKSLAEIGVPLAKARSTIWPFGSKKGHPMGELVESKQLSLQDLGYAVDNARDENVKQAAIALSLVRLNQAVKEPVPSAGFVHIVSGGRSYAKQRETLFTLLQGMIFGGIIVAAFYFLSKSITRGAQPNPNAKSIGEIASSPAGIIALIIAFSSILLIGWFINFSIDRITKRIDKEIEQYRLGQEGEEKTVQLIVQALDGNWHLFRNITLPGRNKADLDLVIVGPPGVWVLEVKNFHGEYRNIGENWEYKRGNEWKAAHKSPSRQALNSAVRLGNFLKADNVKVFVNPAVVWANEENPPFIENPTVAVWSYNRLPDELGNIWHGEKLSKAERAKISEKLTTLCENKSSNK